MRHCNVVTCAVSTMLLLSLLVSGCGRDFPTDEERIEESRKEMAPILEKHRAAAEARFEAIKVVTAEAEKAPPVESREPTDALQGIGDGDPLKAGVYLTRVGWSSPDAPQNTAALQVDGIFPLPLGALNAALKDGHVHGGNLTPLGIDQQFGVLNGLKHAALVRVRRYVPPQASVGTGGEKRFVGGRAIGEVLIYDLQTRQKIGAFPYEVVQDDQATVSGRDEASIQKDLESSFGSNFGTTIRFELAAYAEGKEGPASPGAGDRAALKEFARKIDSTITLANLGAAGIRDVVVANGDDGPTVTIHAKSPRSLTDKDGVPTPETQATVEKILGSKATVTVVKAEEEKKEAPEK